MCCNNEAVCLRLRVLKTTTYVINNFQGCILMSTKTIIFAFIISYLHGLSPDTHTSVPMIALSDRRLPQEQANAQQVWSLTRFSTDGACFLYTSSTRVNERLFLWVYPYRPVSNGHFEGFMDYRI